MKQKKKRLATLLGILLVVGTLTSCVKVTNEETTSAITTVGTEATTAVAETTTTAETTTVMIEDTTTAATTSATEETTFAETTETTEQTTVAPEKQEGFVYYSISSSEILGLVIEGLQICAVFHKA